MESAKPVDSRQDLSHPTKAFTGPFVSWAWGRRRLKASTCKNGSFPSSSAPGRATPRDRCGWTVMHLKKPLKKLRLWCCSKSSKPEANCTNCPVFERVYSKCTGFPSLAKTGGFHHTPDCSVGSMSTAAACGRGGEAFWP